MTEQNEMLNNPLHGLKLEKLLEELVDCYGWEILAEYTRIKCFEKNVTMASSLKFLRKTEWAREKMERFYLYNYKNLPKADDVNFELPPRKRIIPGHIKPRDPVNLILGQAPEPKVRGNSERRRDSGRSSNRGDSRNYANNKSRSPYGNSNTTDKDSTSDTNAKTDENGKVDPWAACR